MEQSPELLAAHQARRAAVDPLLAVSQPLPGPRQWDAELSCPGGVALVRNMPADPDSWGYTYFAAHESKLVPKVEGPKAFAALLDLWAARPEFQPGPDSIATVTWPSRDAQVVRALVERGFVQQSIFAVRMAGRPQAVRRVPGLVIRRASASASDSEAVMRLWMEQLRWDAQFGYAAIRPSTLAGLTGEVAEAVGGVKKRAWLAERDGVPVGLVVVQPPEYAGWASGQIRIGPAGYLNCGAVTARERGGGIGRALVDHVHAELDAAGLRAMLLHYTAVNPLSGPFWSRCGYRPLLSAWTRGTVG